LSSDKDRERRLKAEKLLKARPDSSGLTKGADVGELVHELRVHQIELEMQNEELRTTQAELEKARDHYRDLIDSAPLAYYTLNPAGMIVDVNPAGAKLLGRDRKALLASGFSRFVADTSRGVFLACRTQAAESGIPQHFELELVGLDGAGVSVYAALSRVRDADSGPPLLRMALTDITSVKQAEQALHESNERNRIMVETANEGIWAMDADCRTTYANRRLAAMLGCGVVDLLGRQTEDFMFPEDVPAHQKRIARRRAGENGTYELRLRRKDGSECWTLVSGSPVLDAEGRYSGSFAMLSDITERKQAEAALRASREEYRAVFEGSPLGIYRTTPDGRILLANPALCRMLGYDSAADLCRRDLTQAGFGPGYDRAEFKRMVEEQGEIRGLEVAWIRKDGTPAYFRENARLVRGPDGTALYYDGTVEDISERRRAEESLRTTVDRFHLMLTQMPLGVLVTSGEGRVEFANHEFCSMFSIADGPAALVGLTSDEALPRLLPLYADPERILARIRELLAGTAPAIGEEIVMRDGRVMLVDFMPIIVNGTKAGRLWIHRDITERKRAAETLRLSEEKYKLVVDNAGEVILVVQDGKLVFVNPRAGEMVGFAQEELLGRPFIEFIHADDRALVGDNYRKRLAGGHVPDRYEFRIVGRDGTTRSVEISAVRIDWQGRPATLNFLADVTERRRAEQALRQSNERLDRAQNAAGAGTWDWDIKTGDIVWSPQMFTLLGLDPEKDRASFDSWRSIIHPDDREMAAQRIDRALKERIPLTSEYRVILPDGRLRWISARGEGTYDKQGQPMQMAGICIDISGSKLAEEALRESEERYRRMVEFSPAGILTIDTTGTITSCNEAFVKLSGFPAEQLVDRHFTKLPTLVGQDLKTYADLFARMLKGKLTGPIEFKWRHADGSTRTGEGMVSLLRRNDRRLTGAQVVVTDITERKLAEAEIEWLSRFPRENPSPVLRIMVDGTLAYANPGSKALLAMLGCNVGSRVPADWQKRVHRALSDARPTESEQSLGSTTYSLLMTPITGQGYVNVYGRDITERKRAEADALQRAADENSLLETSLAISRCRTDDDVCEAAADLAFKLNPHSRVLVTLSDPALNGIRVRAHRGFGSLIDSALATLGQDPRLSAISVTEMTDAELALYGSGRVEELPGGLYALMARRVPKAACAAVERMLGVDQAYGVGFNLGSGHDGGIVLLVRKNAVVNGREIIETLVSHVAAAVRRLRAEQALREEKERAQRYLDVAGVMFVALDADGRITMANRRAYDVLGYAEGELVGQTWTDRCIPERLRGEVTRVFSRLMVGETKPVERYENLIVTRSGEERLISWQNVILRDQSGRPIGTLSSGEDVTERRRAEEALHVREEEYRLVVDNVGEAILVLQDWKVVFANPTASKIIGYSHEEVLGRAFIDSIHPADHPLVADRYRRRLAGEDLPDRHAFRIIRRDGEARHIESSGVPMMWKDGPAVLYFLADITERKQAEEELRESQERYRLVVENSMDAILLIRPEGQIVSANPAACRMFGRSEEELRRLGRDVIIDPTDPGLATAVAERDRTGSFRGGLRLLRADGTSFTADVSSVAFVGVDGRRLTSHVVRDLTEVRRAEEALRTSEAQLSNAVEIARLGYWEYDVANDTFTFDDHFYKIFHTTAKQVGGYKMSAAEYARRFVHPDDAAMVGVETRKALETTDPNFSRQVEHRILYADGGVGYVSVRFFIVKDSQGRTVKTYGANQDITERRRAEEALRDSEERFRKFSQTAPDAIVMADAEGHVDFWNEAAERMFGYAREEALGRPLPELVAAPALREQFHAGITNFARTGTGPLLGHLMEYNAMRRDGSEFPVELMMSSMQLQGSWHSIGTIRDITERKRAEELLGESELKFRTIFDSASDGMFLVDQKTRSFVLANNSCLRMLGYSADEFAGLSIADLHPEEDVQFVFAQIESFVEGGKGMRGRLRFRRRDGSLFPADVHPSGMLLGNQACILIRFNDATERTRAEERDRQHAEDTAALHETAVGYIQLAPDADIYQYVADRLSSFLSEAYIIVNSYDAAADHFTVRAIAGIGSRLESVLKVTGRNPVGTEFIVESEHRTEYASKKLMKFEDGLRGLSYGKLPKVLTQTIEKTFDIGGVYAMGIHWQGRILGTVNIIMRRGADIRDPAGVETFVNQAAIAIQHRRDADELDRHRVHLEELVKERTTELAQTQAQLVQQERLATLGRVAGTIAHELRNPLGAIRNASYYLQTFAADKLEGKPLRHLQTIDQYVDRANSVITMILDFTWRQQGEPAKCALRPLVDRALAEAAAPESINVSLDLKPGLPDIFVDGRQMVAVFRNLFVNAAQAMPGGGTLQVSARQEGAAIVVDIADTGCGIKPENFARLFEPLFTTKDIGVGLGLAICQVFIEGNKGKISIASEVGKGTTVTVTLPTAEQ
jgi:PAS domain S-box-containing protein